MKPTEALKKFKEYAEFYEDKEDIEAVKVLEGALKQLDYCRERNKEYIETIMQLKEENRKHSCSKFIELTAMNGETGIVNVNSIVEVAHTGCVVLSGDKKFLVREKYKDIISKLREAGVKISCSE